MGVDEGREAIRGMKTLKPQASSPGRRIKLYIPRLHQSRLHAKTVPEPSVPDICTSTSASKVWKYFVHAWDTYVETDSYTLRMVQNTHTHTHADGLETGPTSPSLYPFGYCT